MSEAALRRVLAGVAVLAGVYLAVTWLGEGEDEAGPDPVAPVLAGAGPDSLRAIRIRRPELSLDVVRGEEGWTVNGFDADTATLAHFFQVVGDARVGELVSRNPSNHADLGLTADSAWSLRFDSGEDSLPTLLVGRRGPYDPSAYVRVTGDDRAYVLRSELRSVMGGALVQWRDKTVVAVDTAVLAELRVARPEGTWRLVRTEAGWRLGEDGPAEATAVRRLLAALSDLDGYAFASDTGAMGPPERELVALDAAGDTLAWFHAAPSGAARSWFARSSLGRGAVYRLAPEQVDRVTPPGDSLSAPSGDGP